MIVHSCWLIIYFKKELEFTSIKKKKKKKSQTSFKVGMNKMPVQPIHDVMSTGHAISGARLLTPLGVDTIVTK